MIERGGRLSVSRQSAVLALNRSGVYYVPRLVSGEELRMMRRIDELHLAICSTGLVGWRSNCAVKDLRVDAATSRL